MTVPRLLIIPGLRDSGPTHWQTWLEQRHADTVRVRQTHWEVADLPHWAARVEATLADQPAGDFIAIAHSFGCLALARHLATRRSRGAPSATRITAALLVAPADPAKFSVTDLLPISRFWIPTRLIASETDPWMRLSTAETWASIWGAEFQNLGPVGHINAESGFGPLPAAETFIAEHVEGLATAAPRAPAKAPLHHAAHVS